MTLADSRHRRTRNLRHQQRCAPSIGVSRTGAARAWLVFGAPEERLSTDEVAWMYPDGPNARPPELS